MASLESILSFLFAYYASFRTDAASISANKVCAQPQVCFSIVCGQLSVNVVCSLIDSECMYVRVLSVSSLCMYACCLMNEVSA
jgi:hypothetical protein